MLDSPIRGYVKINERGRNLLEAESGEITDDLLKKFPDFFNFLNGSISTQTSSKNNSSALISETQPTISPEEEVDQAFNTWKDNFLEELLDQVKQLAWDKFE